MRIFSKEVIAASDIDLAGKQSYWLDFTGLSQKDVLLLRETFGLHPLTIEDFQNANGRVKVEEFPTHIYAIFYGLQNGKPVKIDFVIGKNFLITNHQKDLASFRSLTEDADATRHLMDKGMDFLMHQLLDAEIDHCFVELDQKGKIIDSLEEEAASNPDKKILSRIYSMKRELSLLKRIFMAQREKTGWFAKSGHHYVSAQAIPYFRDVYDHSIHVSDAVDSYREAVANAFDVYMSAMSNNMNEVMKTLSVIATIALPLTVISGIYGTNFVNLPGMYSPLGFWIMLLGMFLLCVFMLTYFWRKKWF